MAPSSCDRVLMRLLFHASSILPDCKDPKEVGQKGFGVGNYGTHVVQVFDLLNCNLSERECWMTIGTAIDCRISNKLLDISPEKTMCYVFDKPLSRK